MLRTRRQQRLSPQSRSSAKRTSPKSPLRQNAQAQPQKKDESGYKRLHRNACRTIVCEFLQYRSQKLNKIRNPSLWLISKTYLKKLEQFQTREPAPPEASACPKERKISWSEEAECVYFNVRKSSASISSSQRHTFFLNDQ